LVLHVNGFVPGCIHFGVNLDAHVYGSMPGCKHFGAKTLMNENFYFLPQKKIGIE
jgi:hypothetical protein